MRIAIVHDDFIQKGGAENLALAFLDIYPEADLYCSIVGDFWEDYFKRAGRKINVSWLQKLPFSKSLYKLYFPFFPSAFESFDFSSYDLVISVTARFSHFILTKPKTVHIAYVNSPGRMFWESNDYFLGKNRVLKIVISPLLSLFRLLDFAAAKRPDFIIANSKFVSEKIKKYWRREPDSIIHPFVDLSNFSFSDTETVEDRGSFLVISRLSAWKRVDIAVKACRKLGLKLVVIGEGKELSNLKKIAGEGVKILGYVSNKEKIKYLKNCVALIHPQKEDFGITALEALAQGKPVIAYGSGGALETVLDGKTGVFFENQTEEDLEKALRNFNPRNYPASVCRKRAEEFSKERFSLEVRNFVEGCFSRAKDRTRNF